MKILDFCPQHSSQNHECFMISSLCRKHGQKIKTRLEIERVWLGQTPIFWVGKKQPKMNCPKMSNILRSSKTSKMASKIALFGTNSKQNKARFTKMLLDKVFIFMNYTRFKEIKREILLLLVLYLKNELKIETKSIYITKF